MTIRGALLFVITACGAAGSVGAQDAARAQTDDYVLLSDDYGGRTYIGMPPVGRNTPEEPIEAFTPATLSGAQIGDLFAQLCLAKPFDRATYDAAKRGLAADFKPSVRVLPEFKAAKPLIGMDRVAATQMVQDHSSYGIASLWTGEGADELGKRQYLRYSGGLIVIGPVKVDDLYAPQCNVTVHVAGLTTGTGLLDRVQAALPAAAMVKRIEKPKYAFAVWTMPFADARIARVTVEASSLNKPAQKVHLTVQLLPVGKTK